jgi:hypothetical protein
MLMTRLILFFLFVKDGAVALSVIYDEEDRSLLMKMCDEGDILGLLRMPSDDCGGE